MLSPLRDEWTRLRDAVRTLDSQTTFILTYTAFAVVLQYAIGDRSLFVEHFASFVPEGWRGLAAWGWWFGTQGVLGFVLPVVLTFTFFDVSAHDMGLGLGNWRLASGIAVAYLLLVAVGTWVLSDGSGFQRQYPHYMPAARDWWTFLAYEALFLFYWFGWEYLWRGFVLFGTWHTFGYYAIFVQTIPFAALHVDKPVPEAVLSVVGGIALGALCWRCRSFWIAVPIHAAQMMLLDFWCSLRLRTGADGLGWDALLHALGGLAG